MNKNRIFLIVYAFVFFISWSKDVSGKERDGSKVKYEEVDIGIRCFIPTLRENWVITNEKEYKAMWDSSFASLPLNSPCSTYVPLAIDFEKYTLIGHHADAGGCKHPDVKRSLVKKPSEKKYFFVVEVEQKGTCEMFILVYSWLLIPKIETDYSVDFKSILTWDRNYKRSGRK